MSLLPLQKARHARHLVDKAVAGSRRRNPRRKEPDGRTWIVRRTNMLARLYAERIGEAASDPIIASAIRKASELQALADDRPRTQLRYFMHSYSGLRL